jgi:MFS superfamily sulfate permease-like transporter
MKIVAAIIVSMCVSAAATYLAVSGSSKVNAEQKSETQAGEESQQLAELRKQLTKARSAAKREPKIELVEARVAVPGVVTDANDLIGKLSDDATTGEGTESQKRIIHYFESLVDGNNDSVTAIASFLEKDLDKEYGRKSMRQQLNLTTAQMEEMRTFAEKQRDEIRGKMTELFSNREMPREEREKKMRAMFEGIADQYKEMMTPEQQAKLEEMGGDTSRNLRSLLGGGSRWGGGDRGRRPGGR